MNGWQFDPPGKPGSDDRDHGLTLRHVSHANHPFASDIGVAAIWINPGRGDEGRHGPFVLAPPDFSLIDDFSEEATRAPKPFDGYAIDRAIRQKYISNPIEDDPALGGELGLLFIEQSYRFSAYGVNPPHEPTGGLSAARIFPYVRFFTINPKIKSIRIDYRMNIDFTSAVLPRGFLRFVNPEPKTQAGVFRDKDEVPDIEPLLARIGSALAPQHAAKQIFAAAEKPVQYEIFGHGLRDGAADKTWDNIHVWPKGKQLPSAPGAFYAGHMHWRWAKSVAEPTKEEKKTLKDLGVLMPGQPQFKGEAPSGALLDPNIPNQTIRFAITRRAQRQAETTEEFETLFTTRVLNGRTITEPEEIKDGDDLDIWLSFEVKRGKSSAPFHGTTFIHGLYFAHEVESKDSPTAFTQGIELDQNKGRRGWLRDPD